MAFLTVHLDFLFPASVNKDIIVCRITLGNPHTHQPACESNLHIDTRPVEADTAVAVV